MAISSGRLLLSLVPLAGALNIPPYRPTGSLPLNALPPAAVRDITAEALTAATLLRKDILPLSDAPPARPLVMAAVRSGALLFLHQPRTLRRPR